MDKLFRKRWLMDLTFVGGALVAVCFLTPTPVPEVRPQEIVKQTPVPPVPPVALTPSPPPLSRATPTPPPIRVSRDPYGKDQPPPRPAPGAAVAQPLHPSAGSITVQVKPRTPAPRR